MSKVTITSSFWGRYRELVRSEMIPYQWNVLNDIAGITIEKERDDAGIPSEKSHAIENFKIAAGRASGTIMDGHSRIVMFINGWRLLHTLSERRWIHS